MAAIAVVGLALLALAAFGLWATMIAMPGSSYEGEPPLLDPAEKSAAQILERDVRRLAETIGERNVGQVAALAAAEEFVVGELAAAGLAARRLPYELNRVRGVNLEVESPGTSSEIVIVGAHYDSVVGTPGADDNASGVAVLLELARRLAPRRGERTLRLVAFANEEPPHFHEPEMGSRVYARACRERGDDVVAMLAIETVGYFSNAPESQAYPFPFDRFYPSTGNFIAFVSDVSSQRLCRRALRAFRSVATLPSEGAAVPRRIPGIGWSDHRSFWEVGYPAVMVTDTAPFRNPNYHTPDDRPDTLDYEKMARVVAGLEAVIEDLVGLQPRP